MSISNLVGLLVPCTKCLLSLFAHQHLCGDAAFLGLPSYFLIDKLVAKVDVLSILFCVAVENAPDARPIDGGEAHGAGFATGVDGAARQAEILHPLAGSTNGTHLGMGCRVIVSRDTVHSCGHNFVLPHNDGTERSAAIPHILDAQVNGLLHESFVFFRYQHSI